MTHAFYWRFFLTRLVGGRQQSCSDRTVRVHMGTRTHRNAGFSLIELLIVVALIGTISAIAVPGLLRSRMSGNEASAMGTLRAILAAQEDYRAVNRAYADDLARLATTCPGMTVPFISPDLNANGVRKSGYIFTVAAGVTSSAGPNDCTGSPTRTTFYSSAIPVTVATTGNRGFATNPIAVIWQDTTGLAPPEPFIAGGTVSPIGQ